MRRWPTLAWRPVSTNVIFQSEMSLLASSILVPPSDSVKSFEIHSS